MLIVDIRTKLRQCVKGGNQDTLSHQSASASLHYTTVYFWLFLDTKCLALACQNLDIQSARSSLFRHCSPVPVLELSRLNDDLCSILRVCLAWDEELVGTLLSSDQHNWYSPWHSSLHWRLVTGTELDTEPLWSENQCCG